MSISKIDTENLAEVEREIINVKKDNSEKKITEYSLTKKIMKHFNAKIIKDSIETKENKAWRDNLWKTK